MNKQLKENDWIVAGINNPTFESQDFKEVLGMNLDNTQLKDPDYYKNSEYIKNQDIFKDKEGNFSPDKFDAFYQQQAYKFSDFSSSLKVDNYEYGFWDTFQKPTSRVKNPGLDLIETENPDHTSLGISGFNMEGPRTKTEAELAQRLKIWDYKEGKYIEYSPEDYSLFTNPIRYITNVLNPFADSLVLATYDKDTEEIDPITGQTIKHKAGEKKLNDLGEYYYETLGGRSIVGKEVLSAFDILTKEDSAINKYDFFDSDDMEKNPIGVITKNLVALAPMVFGGEVIAPIYNGIIIAKELAKALPMLDGVFGSLIGKEEDSVFASTLAAFGNRLSTGTSEKGRQSAFSFENFAGLISDVALQWGQQKQIASWVTNTGKGIKGSLAAAESRAMEEYGKQANRIINEAKAGKLGLALQGNVDQVEAALKYTGASSSKEVADLMASGGWRNTAVGAAALEKIMPAAERAISKSYDLGSDLSLAYMALVSNTDVYESMLEHGATKLEAAAVALGSAIGMYKIDKKGLGEMFFDDTPELAAKKAFRNALRESVEKDVSPVLDRMAQQAGILAVERESKKKGLLSLIQRGKNSARRAVKSFKDDYLKSLKEHSAGFFGKALGEGLEEVAEELISDTAKSIYELAGLFGLVSQKDVGAWENAKDRYLMSFFGGAIGGGLFYGVDAIKNPKSAADIQYHRELMNAVRQGKTNEVLKELEELKNKGQLGDTNLSINTTTTIDPEGNERKTFITADQNNKSQNEFVYDMMKASILLMDNIIKGNQLNLTDDELFDRMILSDYKMAALNDKLELDVSRGSIADASYIAGYFKEFEDITNEIVKNETALLGLQEETKDKEKRDEDPQYVERKEELEKKRKELNKRKEEFFKLGSLYYLEKTAFAMNPEISGNFLIMTKNAFCRKEWNWDYTI